jgi:chaperonin cofactor prefoldin
MGLDMKKMGESSTAMENAKALIAKKDSLEAQIRELQAALVTVSFASE